VVDKGEYINFSRGGVQHQVRVITRTQSGWIDGK